jgi:hypothetical protein
MSPRRVSNFAILLLALLGAAAPASSAEPAPDTAALEMQAAFTALPESNPYRSLLLRYAALPAEDRKALGSWPDARDTPATGQPVRDINAGQRAFAAEVAAALRAATSASPLSHSDWPLLPNPKDPDNPAAITLPGVASLRALARIAARHADDLPPADALEIYAAVAQFGRQQRAGATLIEQLTGVATEGIAHAAASRRLNEFFAADLQRLSEAWENLASAPDNTEAVSGERDLFFRPIVEKLLLPGLRDLIASGATGEEPVSESSPAESDLARDHRLSGLMDLGGDERRIILENTRSGEHLNLRVGRPVQGVELLSLDFEKRVAVIRRGAEEALVHLETRRIVPRKSAGERLRAFFAGFDLIGDTGVGRHALVTALARARAHPDGAEGYARELLETYQAGIDRQVALAESARYPENLDLTEAEKSDPLLALAMPTIGRVCRTFNNSATAATMLQAAIRHRLGELGASVDPFAVPDPWAHDEKRPFRTERLPDGGFILRSAYEVQPDSPLTYKFAAPDAGFVRAR